MCDVFALESPHPMFCCISQRLHCSHRFQLVPKIVKEDEFWRNYFYRVGLVRQQYELQVSSYDTHTYWHFLPAVRRSTRGFFHPVTFIGRPNKPDVTQCDQMWPAVTGKPEAQFNSQVVNHMTYLIYICDQLWPAVTSKPEAQFNSQVVNYMT